MCQKFFLATLGYKSDKIVAYSIEVFEKSKKAAADSTPSTTDTSKQPIRTRYLAHVIGYQPIRDQYCVHHWQMQHASYHGLSRLLPPGGVDNQSELVN